MKCHYCVYELPRDDSKAGYSSVCGQCGMTQPTPVKQLAPDEDGRTLESVALRFEDRDDTPFAGVDSTDADGAHRLDGSD